MHSTHSHIKTDCTATHAFNADIRASCEPSNAVYLARVSDSDERLLQDQLAPEEARHLAELLNKYAGKVDESAAGDGVADDDDSEDGDSEDDDRDASD